MVQAFGPMTFGLAALSLAASAAGVWVTIRLAHKVGLMDFPNERSSHSVPTPRMGGIAMVAAAVLSLQAGSSSPRVKYFGCVRIGYRFLFCPCNVRHWAVGRPLGPVSVVPFLGTDACRWRSFFCSGNEGSIVSAGGIFRPSRDLGPLRAPPGSCGCSTCTTSWTGSTGWRGGSRHGGFVFLSCFRPLRRIRLGGSESFHCRCLHGVPRSQLASGDGVHGRCGKRFPWRVLRDADRGGVHDDADPLRRPGASLLQLYPGYHGDVDSTHLAR